MAHLIEKTDGAVFYKTPAWHGLGYVVQDDMSPEQALVASGLDYPIIKSDGILANGVESKDFCAIMRGDTNSILSVQSSAYQIVQNREMFELAYAVGDTVKMESALSMRGGRTVVALMRGDTFTPANSKNDENVRYAALLNSHDGTLALSMLPTDVRIVCNNTLSMALGARKQMLSVRHSGNMEAKLESMRAALKHFAETGRLFEEKVNLLSSREMTVAEIQNFWLKVWGVLESPVVAVPTTEKEEANNLAAANEIARWSQIFDNERAGLGAPASLWQAANAVTRSLQHKKTRRDFEGKAFANLAGVNQNASLKVMSEALALV